MRTLTSLASALTAVALFAGALAVLGVLCVLGVGMAAAACDLQPPAEMARAEMARNVDRVSCPTFRASYNSDLPSRQPIEVLPDRLEAALCSDARFPTAAPTTPGSVPVL
jgi:hypothetical protein